MRRHLSYRTVLSILIFVLGVYSIDKNESKIVQITQGPVKGFKDPKTGLFSYINIPYATAPNGPNRFKGPLPPPVWKQPLENVDRNIICPQNDYSLQLMDSEKVQMQEDCLVANVHVPDTEETNLPVYVIIHGGAYLLGYGEWVIPSALFADNNIIAVTFNYRLGAHGFLCLGTEDAPGNAGLKDQIALLRWVKKNIASFGGNPNDITIGGCSAGGSSVDLLTVSKLAEGLFNKAIPESGSNSVYWSIERDPLEKAKLFAKTKNFTDVDNFYALQEFYKTASYETIQPGEFLHRTDNDIPFSPCMERPIGQERVIDDDPVNILKKGNYKKVPLLYGFAQMEGLLKVKFFDDSIDLLNKKFEDFLPPDLKFKNEEEKFEVAKEIKRFYFGDKVIDESGILKYLEYVGDVMFLYPQLRTVQLHLKNGHDKIYLYEYSFVDENDPIIPHTNIRRANHCNQMVALCGGKSPFIQLQLTEEYKMMSSLVKKLWANFIKTGTPVISGSPLPEWPAVKRHGSPFMSLGVEVHVEETPLAEERALFWDKIYDKYYREPVPLPTPPQIIETRIDL